MKSLYITSIERYSGKTATCLSLGRRFQADGFNVGYLKPLSLEPWLSSGKVADEDAAFVKETLDLPVAPWELSPVVVTPELLKEILRGEKSSDLMQVVKTAFDKAGNGRDILLLEGGASLREGHTVGLPTPTVATALSSHVLVMVKYRSDVRLLDDALSAKVRLGDSLTGAILNRIPPESMHFIKELAIPFLEARAIPVFGALPEITGLAALTVGEITSTLNAQILTNQAYPESLVETLTVGAMTAEAALRIFRQQTNKAVITGGDRTDIQLAALETSTTCLVLTGNLHPSPLIVKQADALGVTILLVPSNTMETVESIERVFGKTRLGQPAKLAQYQQLLERHLDINRLYQALDLSK
jgi:BioD-like phosphotransacetylase family protein